MAVVARYRFPSTNDGNIDCPAGDPASTDLNESARLALPPRSRISAVTGADPPVLIVAASGGRPRNLTR